jgi:2-hydroxychromene-2-carboxylate isomerase
VQFEFAGALPLADGRYLARSPDADEQESVFVLQRVGAPQATGRRRRRAREVESGGEPRALTLTRATTIRAFAPFADAEEAAQWLDQASEAEDTVDVLVAEGLALLNRALYAQAVATADPSSQGELSAERAERVLLGFGSGEEVADSRFTEAREVDTQSRASRRRRREEELRPQERVGAVLRGRERFDACEVLLLRARADLNAGRQREAALQLRVGLEALLVELQGALADPGHDEDMATLDERRSGMGDAANAALRGEITPAQRAQLQEILEICERVLRRRRVLQG